MDSGFHIPTAPHLSREEEDRLVLLAQQGDAAALDRLVRSNVAFVSGQSARYCYRLSREDALQEGLLGFLRAVKKFQPGRGVNLRTYASHWIMAFVKSAEMSERLVRVWKTQRLRRFRSDVLRRSAAEGVTGFEVLMDERHVAELAERHAMTLEEVRGLSIWFLKTYSIDFVPEDGPRLDPADPNPGPEDLAADRSANDERYRSIRRALAVLTDRERLIVERRRLAEDPPTLQELGAELGISREGVRQVEARALRKLGDALRRDGLDREAA